MENTLDFKKALDDLRDVGYCPTPSKVYISIPDARNLLKRGINHYTEGHMKWLPVYDEIADWLTNNKGQGLMCYGNCGLGKSLICWKIIPVLIHHYTNKIVTCYDAQGMNNSIDEVKRHHLIYIDDVGTENVSVKWGEKRLAFPEIVDECEKKGHLLIITTNLTQDEIAEKYGVRTIDRLAGITRMVKLTGASLRHP